jgi:hypothetical protein
MKRVASTVYVVFLIILAGFAIGAAAHSGLLIQAAVPFAAAIILALAFLGRTPERVAWAAFTVWRGSTSLS